MPFSAIERKLRIEKQGWEVARRARQPNALAKNWMGQERRSGETKKYRLFCGPKSWAVTMALWHLLFTKRHLRVTLGKLANRFSKIHRDSNGVHITQTGGYCTLLEILEFTPLSNALCFFIHQYIEIPWKDSQSRRQSCLFQPINKKSDGDGECSWDILVSPGDCFFNLRVSPSVQNERRARTLRDL